MQDQPNPFAGIAEAAARKRDKDRSNYIGPQTMAEAQEFARAMKRATAEMSPLGKEAFDFAVTMSKLHSGETS